MSRPNKKHEREHDHSLSALFLSVGWPVFFVSVVSVNPVNTVDHSVEANGDPNK